MGTGIGQALLEVYRKVGYVEKGGVMDARAGGYTYAGEADLISALRPAMLDAGIVMFVSGISDVTHDNYETKSGGTMNRVTLRGTVTFLHAESGESILAEALGEGADAGDKATYKAMTGMYKYALRETFCIETGDDPDKASSEGMERASAYSRPLETTQAKRIATRKAAVVPRNRGERAAADEHPIGYVESGPKDGDWHIMCPAHGWNWAVLFEARGDKPAVIKCKQKTPTGDYCQFGVPVPKAGATEYEWEPIMRQVGAEYQDVTFDDLAEVMGVERMSKKAVDDWLRADSHRHIPGLYASARALATMEEEDETDLPFE